MSTEPLLTVAYTVVRIVFAINRYFVYYFTSLIYILGYFLAFDVSFNFNMECISGYFEKLKNI